MTDHDELNGPTVLDDYEEPPRWLDAQPGALEAFAFLVMLVGMAVLFMCLGGTL